MRSAWVILVSCIIGLAFSVSPIFFSTLSVFIKPIAEEFGWGRTLVSSAVSVSSVLIALTAPFVGRLIDRHGPRRVILVSTVALSIVITLFWLLPNSYAAYVVLAAAIGVAGTGSNTFAYLSILPAWFSTRFGMSLAFAMIGIGIGQFVAPLYANWLISEFGWRMAYAILGISIFIVTVPNALLLLKDRPDSGTTTVKSTEVDRAGFSRAEAIRMPVFWRLALSFSLITVAVSGCTVHIVPLLTDRGFTPTMAASTAALIGFAVLIGRFATGFLLDYVNASLLGFLSFSGCATGIALILSDLPGLPLQIGVVLLGTALGVEGDLIAYMVRRVFGMRSYGEIYGLLFGTFSVGVVLGPLLMGLSFDLSGNYMMGLQIMLGFSAVSALLLVQSLPQPNRAVSTAVSQ